MILAITPHHTFATERSTVQPALFDTICTAITALLTDHISRSLGSWQKSLNSVFHDCLTVWATRLHEIENCCMKLQLQVRMQVECSLFAKKLMYDIDKSV